MSYTVSDFDIIALSLISLCFETPDMRLGKEVAEFLLLWFHLCSAVGSTVALSEPESLVSIS